MNGLSKLTAAIAMSAIATPAFAYVDPGTGAMLVQAVLAVAAAVVFYFRNPRDLWRDIKRFLKRDRR